MNPNPFPRWLVIILVIVPILLVAGGRGFIGRRSATSGDAADELQAIAQLKVDQISAWRVERLADAAVLSEISLISESERGG